MKKKKEQPGKERAEDYIFDMPTMEEMRKVEDDQVRRGELKEEDRMWK